MSVQLYWQPVYKYTRALPGQSSTKEALERAFGTLPLELSRGDIDKLQGMSAMVEDQDHPNAYDMLIDAINAHHTVRITTEF